MTVGIVHYGMGNISSVQKAFKFIGAETVVVESVEQLAAVDQIVLPGVGAFRKGMQNLRDRGFVQGLSEHVVDGGKPFLGICLGMQLVFEEGTEPETTPGLGWLGGRVIRLDVPQLTVPHNGWNDITLMAGSDNFLCDAEADGEDVYFIHSYHATEVAKNNLIATTDYGGPVVAAVQHNNIYATQFHPEKSQDIGMSILRSFMAAGA